MRHCEEAKPTWQSVFPNRESACCARHFDFLHKPNPNVPLYADGFGLFVLSAPLTSVSLSKNKFFDRLTAVRLYHPERVAAVDKIKDYHKPDDFIGYRNRPSPMGGVSR